MSCQTLNIYKDCYKKTIARFLWHRMSHKIRAFTANHSEREIVI